jgi:quercetin dioxygenase-like cupin family protein
LQRLLENLSRRWCLTLQNPAPRARTGTSRKSVFTVNVELTLAFTPFWDFQRAVALTWQPSCSCGNFAGNGVAATSREGEVTMRQATIRRFTSATYAALTAALAAVMAGGAYVPSAAQEPPPPITAEPLTPRSVFVDDISLKVKIKLDGGKTDVVDVSDPSRTVVVRYTVQPGAQFPWHSHSGPVVVNIVSGALTYVAADDCVQRTYAAGEAFVDAGQGHVHTAFNPTGGPTVLVATFFGAPAEGPLLIPAAPGGC